MFKSKVICASLFLVIGAGASYAAGGKDAGVKQDSLPMVTSSVRDRSVTIIGDKIEYNISFDVSISNLGKTPIDLAKGCFIAVMPDKSERSAGMIDEDLTKGKLKTEKNLKSFVSFSAADDSIYKAIAVKYKTVCQ